MFITYSCEKQFQDLNNIKTNISIKQKKIFIWNNNDWQNIFVNNMLRFIQIYDSCLLTVNTIGIKEKKQTLYI